MRNFFLKPKLYDSEYLITKLRRNDLIDCEKNYIPENKKAIILDFGSRKSPYKTIFDIKAKEYLTADLKSENYSVDVIIEDDGTLKQSSDSVDLVLSLQVLEHVDNVDLYISEAHRILKPGGLFWLTTHGMWPYHPTPDDYYRWTLSGLKKVVESKFNIVNYMPMMGSPAYAFMIYMHFFWDITRHLNSFQAKMLNIFLINYKFNKNYPNSKRIKLPTLLWIGNIIFRLIAIPLNFIMLVIDSLTPNSIKMKESVVFRITAQKEDSI